MLPLSVYVQLFKSLCVNFSTTNESVQMCYSKRFETSLRSSLIFKC